MKAFAVIIVLGALAMFGTAFFGVYTAPGLEFMPTVESLGKKNKAAKDKAVEESGGSKGIFPANTGGATAERNKYLQSVQKQVAPGG